MVRADPEILKVLALGEDLELTAHVVARNVGYTRSWVHKRLRVLVDHGLVERDEDAFYWITDDGRGFIEGRIDPEKFVEDDENADLDDFNGEE